MLHYSFVPPSAILILPNAYCCHMYNYYYYSIGAEYSKFQTHEELNDCMN